MSGTAVSDTVRRKVRTPRSRGRPRMFPSDDFAELDRIWPAEILRMNVLDQSRFADAVCRSFAADASFLEHRIKKLRSDPPPNSATGVGNLAYLALHAPPGLLRTFDEIHRRTVARLRRKHGVCAASADDFIYIPGGDR